MFSMIMAAMAMAMEMAIAMAMAMATTDGEKARGRPLPVSRSHIRTHAAASLSRRPSPWFYCNTQQSNRSIRQHGVHYLTLWRADGPKRTRSSESLCTLSHRSSGKGETHARACLLSYKGGRDRGWLRTPSSALVLQGMGDNLSSPLHILCVCTRDRKLMPECALDLHCIIKQEPNDDNIPAVLAASSCTGSRFERKHADVPPHRTYVHTHTYLHAYRAPVFATFKLHLEFRSCLRSSGTDRTSERWTRKDKAHNSESSQHTVR